MKRLAGFVALLMAFTLQGCIASTVVLYVAPDGHGRAVITSRVFDPALRAFDSMFSDSPKHAAPEDQLPPPGLQELSAQFGAAVTLASTKLDKLQDGVLRTTVVEFDDVTRLRLSFPPIFAMPAGGAFGVGAFGDQQQITFAMKPHDNGDRLLLVRLPQGRVDPGPDPDVTVFKTDSPEELLFKRAIKGMSMKLFVELTDVPLLRTNAPASKGGRATILDLDLDKLINNLDESKVRRAMTPGSMQEVLWQLGDMPGAVVPREHEVFLEFEGPPAAQTPAAAPAPAAQAPPDTEVYLAPMRVVNGALEIAPAVNITNNPGYDNQPFFTPDSRSVLFTSVRGPAGTTQTDIYRYDTLPRTIARVTNTPESEYSPTVTPGGNMSVIRVELDEAKTQRLWQFSLDGREARPVLESVKPVGYHAWVDHRTLALFVLGRPATLQLADTETGLATVLASDIGRSIQRIPGSSSRSGISFVQRERSGEGSNEVRLVIKELNPSTREISVLTPAVEGSTEADTAWTPDGTLLMVKGTSLYGWKRGESGWKEITTLERLSLSGVTRLAVSPNGAWLALVGPPRLSR